MSTACPHPTVRPGDNPNLDVLRSMAVLYVLVFHVALFFGATERTRPDIRSLGHFGVLMFFVHTSLVLMGSLERQTRQPEAGWSRFFAQFMVRRCFRILPLSMLAVLLVAALHLPVGHLRDHGTFVAVSLRWPAVLANLLLVQNLTGAESVEAPLWSLPYEMQMYLVLPALFVLVRKVRSRSVLLALWCLVAASAYWLIRYDHARAHVLQMPEYVPCFLAGILAYGLGTLSPGPPGPRLNAGLWPIALALLTLPFLARPFSLTAGWLCCLAIALLIPAFEPLRPGRLRQACKLIARYSFGIYLSHFILIWFAFVKLDVLSWPIRRLVFLVLVIGVPFALYQLLEEPMIDLGFRLTSRPDDGGTSSVVPTLR